MSADGCHVRMDYDDQLEPSVGNAGKVFSVEGDVAIARLIDGRLVRWNASDGPELKRGSVVLFGSHDTWNVMPDSAWPGSNAVASVEQVLEDGSVLVEYGFELRHIVNPGNVDLNVKDTIEYDVDGVIKKLDETVDQPSLRRRQAIQNVEDYRFESPEGGPGFADFGGFPQVLERARELISIQFERRKYLDQIKAKPIKGVLFTGPPGTGKTHLARIIAHEAKADFTLISGPEIVSKWVGDTEDLLRRLFMAARLSSLGRAIIFFDEIDSIAERRTSESHEFSKRLVAQLLTLMDGMDDHSKGVMIIAATNRVESLEPALLRPGRFDWEIQFGMPTQDDRLKILEVGARRLSVAKRLPLKEIASLTEGWSAAEVTALWSEAALVAAGECRGQISAEDLARAFERAAERPRRRGDIEGPQ